MPPKIKDICLIGAGGVGTIAAYILEKSQRARVTAVLRSNYALVKQHGFDIDSVDHGNVRNWRPYNVVSSIASATTNKQSYGFIVITTKALPDLTSSLISDLKPLITPQKTALALLQNGLAIEAPFAAAFPNTPILSGVSMIGSQLTSETTIFHQYQDVSKVGAYFHRVDDTLPKATQFDAARLFVEIYNAGLVDAKLKSGARCVLSKNIVGARWGKLLWNASFNTLCTLPRISVGDLLSGPGRNTLLEPTMREVAAIATAAGYGDAVSENIVQLMLHDSPLTSSFRPSMLVDLENGRPLELDVILGAALRVAKEKGVSTPVLSQVYELLNVVQWMLVQRAGKLS
ncbi:ketopantoate reductase [Leptodontidium sp. 2 PMI_412]|nr:ketopantoate reductase [Leptodontidium sp. 2 PMI_412]